MEFFFPAPIREEPSCICAKLFTFVNNQAQQWARSQATFFRVRWTRSQWTHTDHSLTGQVRAHIATLISTIQHIRLTTWRPTRTRSSLWTKIRTRLPRFYSIWVVYWPHSSRVCPSGKQSIVYDAVWIWKCLYLARITSIVKWSRRNWAKFC